MLRKLKKIKFSRVIVYCLMVSLVLFTSLPLIYMVSTAFKPMQELFIFPPRFLVMDPTLSNFSDLVLVAGSTTVPFIRYIFNSLIVSVTVVVLPARRTAW